MNAQLDAALEYYRAGWNVVPLTGKRPLVSWGKYQSTRVREDEIRQWWAKWPEANIGIVTGKVSGIIVLDVDGAEGANSLASESLTIPDTLTSHTGGGGLHYVFQYPDGGDGKLRNFVRKRPGLDFRGDGGIIVAPPSLHPNGKRYEWVEGSIGGRPAPAPAWLLEWVCESAEKGNPVTPEDWSKEVEKGNRNAHLTRLAGSLLVRMGVEDALPLLTAWNLARCKPPLTEAEIRVIVESIATREAAKPDPHPTIEKGPVTEKKGAFRVMSFSDALSEFGLGEVDWTVDGWLPSRTVGLVVAPPGTYKTWLLLNIALAVSTGQPFLGRYPVNRTGPVLVIQQEDPFPLLFSRLATMMNIGPSTDRDGEFEVPAPPPPPNILWHPDRELNFEKPEVMAGLRDVIAEHRPELILLDPLYSMGSMDDYMAKTAQSMLALKQLRDEFGCSFMIAHHTSKGGKGGGTRERAWGSQFLNAWLETGWQVQRGDDDKTIRVRRHFKLTAPVDPIDIKFNITPWSFSVDVSDAEDTPEDKIQEAIMSGRQFGSVDAIASFVGCSKSTAHGAIRKLGLSKDEEGYYGA